MWFLKPKSFSVSYVNIHVGEIQKYVFFTLKFSIVSHHKHQVSSHHPLIQLTTEDKLDDSGGTTANMVGLNL